MKKFLYLLLALLYAVISSQIIAYLLNLSTTLMMTSKWYWVVIVYILLGAFLISAIGQFIAFVVYYQQRLLFNTWNWTKYAVAIWWGIIAVFSLFYIWDMDVEYNVFRCIMAFLQTLGIGWFYLYTIIFIAKSEDKP